MKLTLTFSKDYSAQITKAGLTILCILILFFLGVKITHFVIAFFGIISVIYLLNSKISFGFATVLFIFCFIVSAIHVTSLARPFSIYAFYFLLIGIATELSKYTQLRIIEVMKQEKIQLFLKEYSHHLFS